MTTEIAIMNKSAVALAADSAVTIALTGTQGREHKIFNSANKLFALSKYCPVGIMIYGNASLMGIPWETIIKVYRRNLGDIKFDYLKGYSDHFFKFLDKFNVGKQAEGRYIKDTAMNIFLVIRHKLDDFVEKNAKPGKPLSENDVSKQFRDIINRTHDELKDISKISVLSIQKRTPLSKKYSTAINELIDDIFEKLPLTQNSRAKLASAVINAASVGPQNQSGIVIAGFGKKDIFPGCYNFDVAAIFGGNTIKRDKKENQISDNNDAIVMPFAQSDEVRTFMEGAGKFIDGFFVDSFNLMMKDSFPKSIASAITDKFKLTDKQRQQVQDIVAKMGEGAYDNITQRLEQIKHEKYIQPVLQATGFLNKGELATMAETFVNLVSFRKQVTLEAETVGGPIDVAVITKGDGFIWIKRKYYFDASLNHQFFNNYFLEGIKNEQEKE